MISLYGKNELDPSSISIQYQLVTDRQTDRWTQGQIMAYAL